MIKCLVLSFLFSLGYAQCQPTDKGENAQTLAQHLANNAKAIDINNPKEAANIYQQFNITKEEIVRRKHNIKWMSLIPATPDTWTEKYDETNYKRKLRKDQILERITSLQNESQATSVRNTNLYPICSQSHNEVSWYGDYNQTLSFWESSLVLKIHENPIKSAFLRLYKIPVNDTLDVPLSICNNNFYYRQVRVTVSVYHVVYSETKKLRERRKIICSTMMIPYKLEGWIEMDVQRAIYVWKTTNNPNNNFKVILEVHDEENNTPLKPGNFFMPAKCLERRTHNHKRHNVEILDEEEEDEQHLYIKVEHDLDCDGYF